MNSLKKFGPTAATTLLGLIFTIFGLDGFLHFLPMPPPTPEAGAFLGGLASAGYFFPFLKTTEIAVGVLLLSRHFVPLALTILAPLSLNILAFHLFLAPEGLPLALIVVILQASLAWHHRDAYRALFASSPEASPRARHSGRLSHSL